MAERPMGALALYEALLRAYGEPRWWSEDAYTVLFQSVLVQNTAWGNVEKTSRRPSAGGCGRRSLGNFRRKHWKRSSAPCGFCRGKARAIRALTAWFGKYGFERQNAADVSTEELREELLAIRGVGAETAAVILVYAFFRPSFIVDAYTRRLLGRLGHDFADDAAIKDFFEGALPRDARGVRAFPLAHPRTLHRRVPEDGAVRGVRAQWSVHGVYEKCLAYGQVRP